MAARGGLLKLLDAYIAIGGDTAGFDAALAQSESKAKSSGERIANLFTPSKVFAALATAAGAAFGMALTGANQLDAATKRLVADAGLTGKAADDASHSLAGMYKNNLQGFDAIGAAMAKVHNDMGLVGQAADDETQRFLTFQKATGQASDAVTEFDRIQDAWNLSSADTQSLMDKLIVSHQKFGGSVADSEAALASMAPAMQAANMSIDDGIALLNLFETAGIDASKAPAALARAVKDLKPGQDLNDLIAQLGAIEDPTVRGQKAMEIFGARSGIGLAQAIKPGMTSLADLTASLGETAGASDRAAEASLSWGDRATLAFHQVGGALAEFGTQFGPLLMLASVVGPKMLAGIAAGLGGAGALLVSKVVGPLLGAAGVQSWMTTGTAIGTTIGAAIGPAMAIAAAAAVVLVWASINDQLNQQANAIATQTTEWVKTATVEQMQAQRDTIAKAIGDIANLPFGTTLYGDQLKSLERQFDAVNAEIKAKSDAASSAFRAGERGYVAAAAGDLAAAKPVIQAAATTAFSGIPAAIAGLTASTRLAIADHLAAAAGEIRNRRSGIDAAIDQLNADVKKGPLTQTTELERLLKARSSKTLTDSLHSPDRQIKADAKALATSLDSAIADLKPRPGIMSATSKALMDDLKTSSEPEIKAFAGWFALQVQSQSAVAAALAAIPNAPSAGPGGESWSPSQLAAHQAAIAAGIKSAGSEVVASKAISDLLKAAMASADPVIKADAAAEGSRFSTALAEGINLKTISDKVAAALALLTNGGKGGLTLFNAEPGGSSGGRSRTTGGGPGGTKSFDTGMPYVAHDTLAYIHRSEAVLTVPQADAWRSGQGGGGRGVSVNIEHVEIADAHDEFSLTQSLQFLAAVQG
jgi:hypothetical protein